MFFDRVKSLDQILESAQKKSHYLDKKGNVNSRIIDTTSTTGGKYD